MARGRDKLSAKKVEALKDPGRYSDGGGLYLQVSKWKNSRGERQTSKSWIFRYQFNRRTHDMGLGGFPVVTLAKARADAALAKSMMVGINPVDPLAARNAAKHADTAKKQAEITAAAKRVTFKEAAERYIASHRAGWRNEKHARQWPAIAIAPKSVMPRDYARQRHVRPRTTGQQLRWTKLGSLEGRVESRLGRTNDCRGIGAIP